jgi:hypothetical protein
LRGTPTAIESAIVFPFCGVKVPVLSATSTGLQPAAWTPMMRGSFSMAPI